AVFAILVSPLVRPLIDRFGILLARHWLIAVLFLLAPFLAAAIAARSLRKLRGHLVATGSATDFERFAVRMLDAVIGDRRVNEFRDRHINDIGLTRRSRQGRGPNSI
ncbi:MAG: hypothetical protein ABIV25_13200, partial [Paracoccaceae bacterium]